MEPFIHFGLGQDTIVKKIKVTWPDGRIQWLNGIKSNQVITIERAPDLSLAEVENKNSQSLLRDITKSAGISYSHQDRDYIDFSVQKLLPHKFSQYGPALAVGDVNGDNLDDFFIGGSYGYSGKFFLQKAAGGFKEKYLFPEANSDNKQEEDGGALLFDAENDGDLDLFIASGGYENSKGSDNYVDRFYINDGKGNFIQDLQAIPASHLSKSCVKAADYDNDGDLDLFIGGRVMPENYPLPVSSFILRNDSKPGSAHFTDVTKDIAPALTEIGLVCDMLWTDFDNDGWTDIMLAGEWMPITILKNEKERFRNVTKSSGLDAMHGWWSSLTGGDFDNDGDIDYVAGNTGLNTFYKASKQYPVKIYAGDFNRDGGYDAIPSLYLPDRNNQLQEFPAFGRDDMIKQMIAFKARFTNYNSYAVATLDKVLTQSEMDQSLKLYADCLASCFIRNNGNGKFEMKRLPVAAQLSTVYAMVADDVDGDNNLDLIITGNDYGIEIGTGRYDAFNGLVLLGDGQGNFIPMASDKSGLYIPGDGKSLALLIAKDQPLLLAAQNLGPLFVFSKKTSCKAIHLLPGDRFADIQYADGKKRKEEFYYGNTFYSQSGRYVIACEGLQSITITDDKGKKRRASF
jgi:hypothetical protein